MENRIEMTQHDRDVLTVMRCVLRGERTQAEAAALLGVTARQVRRIQRRLESEGDAGVIHRLRGRASNRQIDGDVRDQVLKVYQGISPTSDRPWPVRSSRSGAWWFHRRRSGAGC
jgi:DNA-binding Lrp family transcriptional regulator